MEINYIIGDATQPAGDGSKIIVHICNDMGGWGRGFVMAFSERWPEPEQQYRAWHRNELGESFSLGNVQFVQVNNSIWVANLIGQRDIRVVGRIAPVRYEAIRKGLSRVAKQARRLGASVHMPRIGCGLAGGKWEDIRKIVEAEFVNQGVSVTVYDLPQKAEQ